MPKVVVSNGKGLHQIGGSGVEIENNLVHKPGANSSLGLVGTYGVHEVAYEFDIGGLTLTNTENGLVRTICSFTTNIRVLQAAIICTESNNENVTAIVDIVGTADAATAFNDAITVTGAEIFTSVDLKSSVAGTAGVFSTPAFQGGTSSYINDLGSTGDKIVVINRGTANDSAVPTAGKFILWLKYVGSSTATALTTV